MKEINNNPKDYIMLFFDELLKSLTQNSKKYIVKLFKNKKKRKK